MTRRIGLPAAAAAAVAPAPGMAVRARAARAAAPLSDWVALLKPRVVGLVLFTAWVGLIVAPGEIAPLRATAALLCIAAGAGAAGALNMWYDRDIDAVMRRTCRRPIPAGRITRARR